MYSTRKPNAAFATLAKSARPTLEVLEAREVLYGLSGNAWIRPELITISFVPDGTVVGSNNGVPITSNLHASFNARFGSVATWQNLILKAAQTWAVQTNINFKLVSDNGADIGSLDNQQGDPNVGDIRIGGYNYGNSTLAQAYLPPNSNNTDFAGDIQFNTGQTWNNGSQYDLYSVAMHEFGHALGLYHGATGSVMYGTYQGTKTGLATDDVNGIRAVVGWTNGTYTSPGYGGARAVDAYDGGAGNGTFANASNLTTLINATSKTALVQNLDLTSTTEVDFFKFTVPTGMGGSLRVVAQSAGLSLLAPTLTLYNGSQAELVSQSGLNQYGTTLTVTTSVTAGQTYYVKVAGADTTVFASGKYALTLAFAGVASPTVPLPNTTTANDPNPSAGGGLAIKISLESGVNTTTTGSQAMSPESLQAVASDQWGNYVVTWASFGQDGGANGVYARLYSVLGFPLTSEFRVNTTTSNEQMFPAVAMAPNGNFVITWSSKGQDNGATWGIYAQRYNALGTPQGGEFRVNTTTANEQQWSRIATDATGNFVITWSSKGQDNGTSWGVYAQRYNASGVAQGSEFRVNTTTDEDQRYSAVAMAPNGHFVITWTANGDDDEAGIFAKRYNASGVAQGGEFRVNTTTSNDQVESSVAMDANGNFIVTWTKLSGDGSGGGVYAQRYTAAGVANGGDFRVNMTTAGDQRWSTVAMDASGNFLVTWSSYNQDASSSWGVYARQYSASGTALGNEFQVNTTTTSDQRFSSVTMTSIGTATVVWSGSGSGDADGIYAQRYQLINALQPMQAAMPHGFNPDGCGCGDAHAHADEGEGGGEGCGCATCHSAVILRSATTSNLDVSSQGPAAAGNAGELLQALLRATAGADAVSGPVSPTVSVSTPADERQLPATPGHQGSSGQGLGQSLTTASRASTTLTRQLGDPLCISAPSFGVSWEWFSPLSGM